MRVKENDENREDINELLRNHKQSDHIMLQVSYQRKRVGLSRSTRKSFGNENKIYPVHFEPVFSHLTVNAITTGLQVDL